MKMTVATRVVGGFAVITSLLIVMGIFSLTTLSNIEKRSMKKILRLTVVKVSLKVSSTHSNASLAKSQI